MSEFKPISKPNSKGLLSRSWLFIKAFVTVIFAWIVAILFRILIGIMLVFFSILLLVFLIIYGTRSTSKVIEMVSETLGKYRI